MALHQLDRHHYGQTRAEATETLSLKDTINNRSMSQLGGTKQIYTA